MPSSLKNSALLHSVAGTKLEQLAAYAPALREWEATPRIKAPIVEPKPGEQRFFSPPPSSGQLEDRFREMLWNAGWVDRTFNYVAWGRTPEGISLKKDRGAIREAEEEELLKLLTLLVRRDRMAEGAFTEDFESGLVLVIAERAETLLKSSVDVQKTSL